MKSSFFRKSFIIIFVLSLVVLAIYSFSKFSIINRMSSDSSSDRSKNEILHLEVNGVIMNGKKFLHQLKKYSKESSVKAIVIEINSPGGAVGPSQEMYLEILRTKNELKKPIICVSTGLIASGGYYTALACDKIVVAPGAMIGSIGVIMEFVNLEELYSWAKVKRFTITSGKFKDSGSEYRSMRPDEKELFQNMIDDVYNQFKNAVIESRKLDESVVSKYADGRVMTGKQAVSLKFADQEGTFEDAVRVAADTANLNDDYQIFKPKKASNSWVSFLFNQDEEEDELNSLSSNHFLNYWPFANNNSLNELAEKIFKTKYNHQPMYIVPGYL